MLTDMMRNQCGVVSRDQTLSAGLTRDAILARTRSGRRQRIHRSTYATFSGELSRSATVWAAVLAAGEGATLSHHTAAELTGLTDESRREIHLTIPSTRRITPIDGVVVHMSGRLAEARHPVRTPAQTRIEETVLDLVDGAKLTDDAVGWLATACGRRLTTPSRLAEALDARPRLRWRRDVNAALADVALGCHSVLELAYLHDVERAHHLPQGQRQAPAERFGGHIYQDVRYAGFGTVVELDGVVAHPSDAIFRDLTRDNVAAMRGESVLHYGWSDVTTRPCEVAAQVAARLKLGGRIEPATPCRSAHCLITKT